MVTTPSGRAAAEAWDGYCDILEAVEAANTDRAVRECPAGAGADRILLTAGATYPTAKTLRLDTPVAIGVAGGGGGRAAIVAAADFVTRSDDRWSGCLVYASVKEGAVELKDLTLSQDPAVSVTGACVTFGFFEIRDARVTGFRQGGIVGYCLPELGCDNEIDRGATTIKVLGSLIDGNDSARPGGGVASEGAGTTLIVEHTAVVNNGSRVGGGGLYFGGGWNTHRIEHSTVSGNTAPVGGGVLVSFASCTATYLYVLNSTIAHNTAASTGGGIQFDGNVDCYAQDVTVLASIVSNNAAGVTSQENINADWKGGQFNCDRGSLLPVAPGLPLPSGASGTPCRFDVADAWLAPLTVMGGVGNLPVHPPRRGSPAIDAAPDDLAEDQQRDSWISLFDAPSPPAWTLFDRVVDGDGDGRAIRDVGAYEVNELWQTELLAVGAKGPAPHAVVTAPAGYNRGAGTAYGATDASGQFVTYVVPIAEPGNYAVGVGVRQAADAGEFQAAVADDAGGPWTNLGTVHETYAEVSAFVELSLTASHGFLTAGEKFLRLTVMGKSPASAGHHLFVDYVRMAKVP
ncbi:MAG: hypothetical protein ABUS79_02035 [Pseudomonadota bacterium]